jgi:GNAT superfamily N-acetyltransferase
MDIEAVERIEDRIWDLIGGGVHAYNISKASTYDSKRICVVAKENGEEIGGLIGEMQWDWFSIDLMFLKDGYRGKGIGKAVLAEAERLARRCGATHAYLDTFSFQAFDFYRKSGYAPFGALDDFPAGHRRYYMKKDL